MTVTDAQLENAKTYMRVEGNDDDVVIKALLAAAALYLQNAGIEEPTEDGDLYNLALWSLTLHYYDHRDSVGNEASLPIGLRPIINQLKLTAITSAAEQ